MLIAKLSFLSAAVLLPFTASKGQIRGDHAYEPRLPSLLPVESFGPCRTMASPPQGAPLATHLRLVRNPENESQDASTSRPDESQSSLTTGLKSSDYWTRADTLKPCSVRGFVSWLRRHDITAKLTWREFYALHLEYGEYVNAAPLTERQLQIEAPRYGIEKTRPNVKSQGGKRVRPYLYQVRTKKRAA